MLKYYLKNKENKYPHFEKDWNVIPHIDIASDRELERRSYDVLITGSDSIWEYSVKDFGDDVHLIGNNMKCNKLIAYAPSFGDMMPSDSFDDFVKAGLANYDFISVRDETSQQIVNKLSDGKINPYVVIDPTLLYDFRADGMIKRPDRIYEKYILVYGHDFPERLISNVKDYATRNNLKIIGAGLAPLWCDVRLPDIDPLDWIGMFAGAEFVLTCTFHGLMFSVNYNRKFIFNQVAYVKNRSEWLLDKLGLSDYIYNPGSDTEAILNRYWDYQEVNKRLNELRNTSTEFLKKALL